MLDQLPKYFIDNCTKKDRNEFQIIWDCVRLFPAEREKSNWWDIEQGFHYNSWTSHSLTYFLATSIGWELKFYVPKFLKFVKSEKFIAQRTITDWTLQSSCHGETLIGKSDISLWKSSTHPTRIIVFLVWIKITKSTRREEPWKQLHRFEPFKHSIPGHQTSMVPVRF